MKIMIAQNMKRKAIYQYILLEEEEAQGIKDKEGEEAETNREATQEIIETLIITVEGEGEDKEEEEEVIVDDNY